MQTIATSELVRIFMQIKLQNYQKKKKKKKNEQRAKPCCSWRSTKENNRWGIKETKKS